MTESVPSDETDEQIVAAYLDDAADADDSAQTRALLATSRLTASFEARMRITASELADLDRGSAGPDEPDPADPSTQPDD